MSYNFELLWWKTRHPNESKKMNKVKQSSREWVMTILSWPYDQVIRSWCDGVELTFYKSIK